MKSLNFYRALVLAYSVSLLLALTYCGKTQSGGNVMLQSAPLSGPNAAFQAPSFPKLAFQMLAEVLGETTAQAAVSAFTSFKVCNDTLIFKDGAGNALTINGSQNPSIGQGLLDFSPVVTTTMAIGSLDIPAGTTVSEIDITFAVVPSVCQGASYAVEFNPGSGVIDITQNTAFKFQFPSPITVSAATQTLTLKFGDIVNGMVALGASLNDSNIQTVSVGQAE